MSFQDKVILITGASSGIGAACAEYFAKKGALLALVGRNATKFENVLKKIKEDGCETVPLVILADVSTDTTRIIDETIKRYNRLDVLINNAGFNIRGFLANTKIENYDAIMATNVRGVFLLTQLALPYLIASKGNVVNVSSVGGLMACRNNIAYAMAKAAQDQFTRCAALELAPDGVRVNGVNPGLIVTDFHFNLGMNQDAYAVFLEDCKKMHPIGRVGQSPEVVDAIAFLANENAGFVTGVNLPVDGGSVLQGFGNYSVPKGKN